MKFERDPAEFHEQLVTQLRHLRRSADAFDVGDSSDGQRLSVIIRTLVHDTRTSTSLLGHLGVKDQLTFIDTRLQPHEGLPLDAVILHAGLAVLRVHSGVGVTFAAPLDKLSPERQGPATRFLQWWTEPVVSDLQNNAFARRDFVLSVANQDGGVHIDQTLGARYAALTRNNSMGIMGSATVGEVEAPVAGIAAVMGFFFLFEHTFEVLYDLRDVDGDRAVGVPT